AACGTGPRRGPRGQRLPETEGAEDPEGKVPPAADDRDVLQDGPPGRELGPAFLDGAEEQPAAQAHPGEGPEEEVGPAAEGGEGATDKEQHQPPDALDQQQEQEGVEWLHG